jgi:hypothetical protein
MTILMPRTTKTADVIPAVKKITFFLLLMPLINVDDSFSIA